MTKTRKRNPRTLMLGIVADIARSMATFRGLLELPSLYYWRSGPGQPFGSYRDHGSTGPRRRADVEAWEYPENDRIALWRVIGECDKAVERISQIREIAQARMDELDQAEGNVDG